MEKGSVDFVRQDDDISRASKVDEALEDGLGDRSASRVVWIVDYNHSSVLLHQCLQLVQIGNIFFVTP